MEEAFKHFDKDGCGSITAEGFSTGLREMGIFQEFSEEEVKQVCLRKTPQTLKHYSVSTEFIVNTSAVHYHP